MKDEKIEDVYEEGIEDVVFEEGDVEKSTFSSGDKKEEKMKDKIKVLEKEKNEYLDGWQRARAEMVNLKKNHLEEKKLFTSLGKESFLLEIIPVLDNFDAAFSNKQAWEKVDSAWRIGVEYIYSQFINILENNGVEQFGTVGEVFDELKHLSVENIISEEENDEGKVSEVIQKGYKTKDRILREAKVKTFIRE